VAITDDLPSIYSIPSDANCVLLEKTNILNQSYTLTLNLPSENDCEEGQQIVIQDLTQPIQYGDSIPVPKFAITSSQLSISGVFGIEQSLTIICFQGEWILKAADYNKCLYVISPILVNVPPPISAQYLFLTVGINNPTPDAGYYPLYLGEILVYRGVSLSNSTAAISTAYTLVADNGFIEKIELNGSELYNDNLNPIVNFSGYLTPVQNNFKVSYQLGFCVHGDTPVRTGSGLYKPIRELAKDDTVNGFLEGRIVPATVMGVLVHKGDHRLRKISVEANRDLVITDNHQIYVQPGQWVEAGKVQIGDELFVWDGQLKSVGSRVISIIEEHLQAGVVYNLKTSTGNYFASDLLIHNKCLAPETLIETRRGPKPIMDLRVNDEVLGWSDRRRRRVWTRVSRVFRKRHALDHLPGKQLGPRIRATVNHRLVIAGREVSVGKLLSFPDVAIKGEVYDLLTESNNYYVGNYLSVCSRSSASH
jgi:hypothetical protein